jgi:hypothetical protein
LRPTAVAPPRQGKVLTLVNCLFDASSVGFLPFERRPGRGF